MKKKSVAILGSTGSIGKSSINVLKKLKNFKVSLIFSNKNYIETLKQINLYKPKVVVVKNFVTYSKLKKKFNNKNYKIINNYKDCKNYLKKIDITISALPGIEGLEPTIFFTEFSKKILIANKESIICGWKLIKRAAKKNNTEIIPIDSEHFSMNFLFKNYKLNMIHKIYITASGGPFLKFKKNQLKNVSQTKALKHPKWRMGKKISIDSATMMNKVLEVIEALNLFSLKLNQIEILIHPESLIHSIFELKNGLKIFIYHEPNMQIPIANAIENSINNIKKFKFYDKKISKNLSFLPIDNNRFPVVNFLSKININNSSAILLNAANEIFVDEFLKKNIKFTDIYRFLNYFLNSREYLITSKISANSISTINKINLFGKNLALKIINKKNV